MPRLKCGVPAVPIGCFMQYRLPAPCRIADAPASVRREESLVEGLPGAAAVDRLVDGGVGARVERPGMRRVRGQRKDVAHPARPLRSRREPVPPAVGRLVDVHAADRVRDRHVDDVRPARVERERLSPIARGNRSKRRNRPAHLARCARAAGERRRPGAASAASVEADQTGHARSCSDGERGSVPDPPAPRPPARLLDQRLQIGDALLEIAVVLVLGPPGRCDDGHR